MTPPLEVVRNARARRAKLSVDPASGRVRLTLPPRAPLQAALRWAEGHRGWIEAQRERLPAARPFVVGATIPLGDDLLTIDWRADRPRQIAVVGAALLCGGPEAGLSRRIEAWLKREALRILAAETAEFAGKAGVTVARVGIGDARSRWGSCASDGTIRYSWRLILAPVWVRRGVVAHEVAHRRHMNHGPEFHALEASLAETDPAAKRAWLRSNGAALHWFGRGS